LVDRYPVAVSLITTTNHITSSGYTYDAAGNMTNDTFHSYTYDAGGNITKVDGGSTATYVYDVFNDRIHVQTGSATNEYIYDYAGRRVSTWLSPSNYGSEGRIYWDGEQVAYRSTDGTTYFDHQDTLGTERMRTNYAGSAGSSYVSLPWGDGYTTTVNASGADQDNEHFAGLERDAESDTEHAQFRNYASAQGRWLAPDPYTGSYDLTNPQSMNRYAYALNNPSSMLDPSGLETVCVDQGDGILYCSDDGSGNGGGPCSSDFEVCVSGSNGNGPSTTNPGCLSYGTQGCVSPNCESPYGCDGQTPPGTGGGGLLGPPRTAILSNAPNNNSSKQTPQQKCLDSFYNSKLGATTKFFSAVNLITNFNSAWPDWTVIPGAKAALVGALKYASNSLGGVEALSVTGGSSMIVPGAVAAAIDTAESAAGLGLLAIPIATAIDAGARQMCNDMPAGFTFFSY
jgi:RHS repeat-associated protein